METTIDLPASMPFQQIQGNLHKFLVQSDNAFLFEVMQALSGANSIIPFETTSGQLVSIIVQEVLVVVIGANDPKAINLVAIEKESDAVGLSDKKLRYIIDKCQFINCLGVGSRGLIGETGGSYYFQQVDWASGLPKEISCVQFRESEVVGSEPTWYSEIERSRGAMNEKVALSKIAFSIQEIVSDSGRGVFASGLEDQSYPQDPVLWITGGKVLSCEGSCPC